MNLQLTPKQHSYTESGQTNPIKWLILSKQGENLVNESNWIKCRDYFNDYAVAYKGGGRFSIYGLNTKGMNIPAEGENVYIGLSNLTKQFESNVAVFNEWCIEKNYPLINLLEGDSTKFMDFDVEAVLEIPPFYLQNTHQISLLTLILRILNTNTEFKTFEEVIKKKDIKGYDQTLWNAVVTKGIFFSLPEKASKFLFYSHREYNNEKLDPTHYSYSGQVHNNGVVSWINSGIL